MQACEAYTVRHAHSRHKGQERIPYARFTEIRVRSVPLSLDTGVGHCCPRISASDSRHTSGFVFDTYHKVVLTVSRR